MISSRAKDDDIRSTAGCRFAFLLTLGLVSCLASSAVAQSPGPAQPSDPSGAFTAGVGFGQVDEDWFLTTRLNLTMGLPVPRVACEDAPCFTDLRFGVDVPLRWRVIDEAPETDDTLRKEDWDETSDYFRVVRFVEYGHPSEPLHARVGELGSVVLGHGTIVNGYHNVVTPDQFQFGVHANVNTSYGGAQVLLDNVADPEIFGVRGYVRPWGFFNPQSFWHRLAVGMSFVSDTAAPLRLLRDENGDVVVEPYVAPEVAESQVTSFTGIDAELALVENKFLLVMPYTDFNIHWGEGVGYHLGTLLRAQVAKPLGLSARLEFRWLSNHYLPDYIGPLYEIDRYHFDGWGAPLPAPKLRVAASQERGAIVGMYGEAGANILNLARFTFAYADYQGEDNGAMWLRLNLTKIGPVALGAFYYKQNFDGFDEAFELDGALTVVEAQVFVAGPFFVQGQYSRLWRLVDDGTYETVDDWNVGAGASFAF